MARFARFYLTRPQLNLGVMRLSDPARCRWTLPGHGHTFAYPHQVRLNARLELTYTRGEETAAAGTLRR
jgi:hypothetical protein